MKLKMSLRKSVKILFAGKTEGEAGKFDRITFVVPLLLAEDYTVTENIGKFDDVILI